MPRPPKALLALVALCAAACAPELVPPRESIRLTGTLADPGAADRPPTAAKVPLGVVVYETCSTRLLLLEKCPGKFLGETKLAKTGPFLIEVDSEAPELTLFAFRGFLGQEEACASATLPTGEASKPIDLELVPGTCPAKLTRPY